MRKKNDKIVLALLLACIAGPAAANPCSDCHTMHNSQDRLAMRFDSSAPPLPMLLRRTCIQCHEGLNSSTSLSFPGPGVYSTSAPTYVWGNTVGSVNTTLAGGSFYYVVSSGEAYGHNVHEITATGFDSRFVDTPPGGTALLGPLSSPKLQCAGLNGCHGDSGVSSDPMRSLKGAHHGNVTGASVDGTSVARSYRFLNGVLGGEDNDWEFIANTNEHNKYVGEDRSLPTQLTASTMSGFCAKCHGYFHNITTGGGTTGIVSDETGFDSPWLRHPTDYDMSTVASTEYASYNTYDTRAPVARLSSNLSDPASSVGTGKRIIMCLTCHRAHGSPNYAALRWDYRGWPASGQDGCQVCHTSKN